MKTLKFHLHFPKFLLSYRLIVLQSYRLTVLKSYRLTVLLPLCLFLCNSLFAQHQADNWIFAQWAGLNFNLGQPVSWLPVGTGAGFDNGTIMSDSLGNLLFFSNGDKVWNKNGEIMENGDNILPGSCWDQSAISFPRPGVDETGEISYQYMVNKKNNGGGYDAAYGCEISPDSKYLYLTFEKGALQTEGGYLYQLDMKYISDSTAFVNSGIEISNQSGVNIQLANDGKIYTSVPSNEIPNYQYFIGVINKPWEGGGKPTITAWALRYISCLILFQLPTASNGISMNLVRAIYPMSYHQPMHSNFQELMKYRSIYGTLQVDTA